MMLIKKRETICPLMSTRFHGQARGLKPLSRNRLRRESIAHRGGIKSPKVYKASDCLAAGECGRREAYRSARLSAVSDRCRRGGCAQARGQTVGVDAGVARSRS